MATMKPSALSEALRERKEALWTQKKISDLIAEKVSLDYDKLFATDINADPGTGTTNAYETTKSGDELIKELSTMTAEIERMKALEADAKMRQSIAMLGRRAGKSHFAKMAMEDAVIRGRSAMMVSMDDMTPPMITLHGGTDWKTIDPKGWRDPGFTATDASGEDITDCVEVHGEVGDEPGVYTLDYVVGDAYGNTARATRKVTVIEERGDFMHQDIEPDEQSMIDQITDAEQLEFGIGFDMNFNGGMVAVKYTNGQFRKKSVNPCTLVATGAYNGKKKGVILQFITEDAGVIASVSEKSGMRFDLIEIPLKELTDYFPIPQIEHMLFMAKRPGDTVDLHADELTADLPDFGVF